MIKKKKMIRCLYTTTEITCNGCGGVLWTPAHRGRMQTVMWQAWYDGPEVANGEKEPEEVHFCQACFQEALEYICGKKEAERLDKINSQAKAGKRFRSPSGDNAR